jgi:hypothetical protein
MRVWLHYGRLTGFMFFGSCVGAIAWAANMQYLTYFFESSGGSSYGNNSSQLQHVFAMGAAAARWRAVFLVLYPIEVCCLIAVMLLLTHRLIDLLEHRGNPHVWRISLAAAFSCSLAGLAGNIVVAQSELQLFYLSGDGVAAIAANNTVAADSIQRQFSEKATASLLAASIQPFTEALALLPNIIVVFWATNAFIRRIRSSLGLSGILLNPEFSRIMRQIIVACAAVMLTLGLRASYAALHATSSAFQTSTDTCFDACDSSCMNQFSLLQRWLDFTPEFRALVVLVSSPMLMLITLWSLTSSRTAALLRGGADRHQPLLGPGMHSSYIPQARGGNALGFQSVHRPAARAARLPVTPIDLDNSSSTFVQKQEPESTASDSSRCRCYGVGCASRSYKNAFF